MQSAWIGVIGGLAGVLTGSALTEVLRRANRIEHYASRVFDKRMQVYEQLFAKIVSARSVAEEVMEQGKYSPEKRHAIISAVIFDIAEYSDDNALYLNDELTLHCVGSLMGAEDVAEIEGAQQREQAAEHVRSNLKSATEMIRAESGIKTIEKFFGKLTRAKLSSPLIEYYRKISKERRQPLQGFGAQSEKRKEPD